MGKKKKRKKSKSLPKGLPEKFLTRLETIVGTSLFSEIRKTFVDKPTTFRVNTIKTNRDAVLEELKREGFKVKRVSWYADAFILENKTKRALTDLQMYKDGHIYIQSLASMVPPLILDPKPGEKVLDLTASPGSKTSQIAALMEQKGELVANDLNKVRFFRLQHNMEALGVPEVALSSPTTSSSRTVSSLPTMSSLCRQGSRDAGNSPDEGDPCLRRDDKVLHRDDKVSRRDDMVGRDDKEINDWEFTLRMEDGSVLTKEYPDYFDKILVDAPCSGESRFIDGYPKSYGYWSEHKIKSLTYRQHKLLMAAWSALKPGGVLVYSTCTIAPEENEARVSKLKERFGSEMVVEPVKIEGLKVLKSIRKWKNKEYDDAVEKTLRIQPTKDVEGFFVAKLSKKKAHRGKGLTKG